MTPIEIGLTVAVVVVGVVAILAACEAVALIDRVWRLEKALDAACDVGGERYERACVRLKSLEDQSDIHQGRISTVGTRVDVADRQLGAVRQTLRIRRAAAGVQFKVSARHERELRALEAKVAGMEVSREALTEPEFKRTMTATTLPRSPHFKDAVAINAAHASTDFDLTGPDDDQPTERLSIDEPPIRCGDVR